MAYGLRSVARGPALPFYYTVLTSLNIILQSAASAHLLHLPIITNMILSIILVI